MLPCVLTGQLYPNGDTTAELRTYKYKDITSTNCRSMLSIRYRFADNNGIMTLVNIVNLNPSLTNTASLGSPALQWNNTYTRNILIDNDINIASSMINKTSNSGTIGLRSGTYYTDGASLALYGKNYNGGLSGCFTFHAYGNYDYTYVRIYPNGTMNVYNNSTDTTKNIAMQEDTVPRSGGAVMTGDLGCATNDTEFLICGGDERHHGGSIALLGTTLPTNYCPGAICLIPQVGNGQEEYMWTRPDGTWTWSGQAVQLISDARLKQQITQIDNDLLDAWEDVELVQFKYNDAVEEKGNQARLHTGYVVQQIDTACKSHNVDISEYGLYCHEEYPERTEEVTIENEDGTTSKETKVIEPAKEHYSLRYTEALVVECAYLRRENKRLNDRLTVLEELFKQYIAK